MNKFKTIAFLCLITMACLSQVNMQINTNAALRKNISPYIYGLNGYVFDNTWTGAWATGLSNHGGATNLNAMNITAWRLGGNAMTPYNWENGANNAGNDDSHKNSSFESFIVTGSSANTAPSFYSPAQAIVTTQNHALSLGAAALIQLPTAGYVAADITGTTCGTPLSTPLRWKKVVNTKPAAFSLTPNLTDSFVYVDEEINFLKNTFGDASTTNGIKFYQADNEVGLWAMYGAGGNTVGTHSVMHPTKSTCNEIITKTYNLAKTIKTVDPNAKVFSGGRWGYAEGCSLWSFWDGSTSQKPTDWATYNVEPYKTNSTLNSYRYNKMTWQNAFLANMKQKEILEGKRLLDVYAIHYYPEGISNDNDRVQAPRSLWDTTYVENSWITQVGNGYTEGRGLNMIPLTQKSITDFYPGTKLAITEYDFYGRDNISGTIAQADALGIFGKQNVYYATYFGIADQYISSAFKIFRNYDGSKNTFGSIGVQSTTSNNSQTSIYTSVDDATANTLHTVLINKSASVITASINISGSVAYTAIQDAYGISQSDGTNLLSVKSKINLLTSNSTITGNVFTYQMQPKSVYHLVLKAAITTLVSELEKQFNVAVSPNPASNQINIQSTVALKAISVFDVNGKKVLEFALQNSSSFTIPTNTLSNGIYFIQLKNEMDQINTQKLIVNQQ